MIKHALTKHLTITAVALLGASALPSFAQEYTGIQDAVPINPLLDGNTKDDGWYNISGSPRTVEVDGENYSINGLTGYPSAINSSPAYTKPIASQVYSDNGGTIGSNLNNAESSSRANFNKVANGNGSGGLSKFNADGTRNAETWGGSGFGPMPSGSSLYSISFSNQYNARGGTLGVFEENPLENLQTIVLQLELGSANGYDFYRSDSPTGTGVLEGGTVPLGDASGFEVGALTLQAYFPKLHLTLADESTIVLSADYASVLAKGYNGTIPMPTGPEGALVDEDIWINLYGFQWDLSDLEQAVSSYVITWDVAEHSQSYAVRVTQSDTFNPENTVQTMAVPEPGSAVLLAGAGCFLLLARRRRSVA